MKQEMVTPNEALQLNELLTLKNLSLTKSLLMSPMISDSALREIIEKDTAACVNHIRELKSYMEKSKVSTMQGGYA
jgi:spore coat protein CotF